MSTWAGKVSVIHWTGSIFTEPTSITSAPGRRSGERAENTSRIATTGTATTTMSHDAASFRLPNARPSSAAAMAAAGAASVTSTSKLALSVRAASRPNWPKPTMLKLFIGAH